jgi:hypothetical protein
LLIILDSTLPPAAGFHYIVQTPCSLTAWPEWCALHVKTVHTLAVFIFEDFVQMGSRRKIVTDYGTAFITALDLLADHYGIGTSRSADCHSVWSLLINYCMIDCRYSSRGSRVLRIVHSMYDI